MATTGRTLLASVVKAPLQVQAHRMGRMSIAKTLASLGLHFAQVSLLGAAMQTTRRFNRIVFLFSVIGLSACEDEVLCKGRPTQEFESEHFFYRTCPEPDVVGPEILTELEAHLSVMHSYLGFDTSGIEFPIRYVAHPVASDYRSHYRVVHNLVDAGNHVVHEHELIHSYLSGYPRPLGLLEEGVAESLRSEFRSNVLGPHRNWRDLLDNFLFRDEEFADAYGHSRRFVTYLLVNFGAPTFLAFYRAAPAGISAQEFSAEFSRIYGRDLDGVWEAAMIASLGTVLFALWHPFAPAFAASGADTAEATASSRFRAEVAACVRPARDAGCRRLPRICETV
jgi:hypothetical protein